MKDLSLHILDVVENALRSKASLVEILLIEDLERDVLVLQIKDDGEGMDPETLNRATDPFFTSKGDKKVGLGLPLLAQAAREAGGKLELSSSRGVGTTVRAVFRHSHPDRKPLGDMAATLQTLVGGNPDVDFLYEHKRGTERTRFDTREIRPS